MEYRRNYQDGGVYFFTVVTQSRRPLLIENIHRLRLAFSHVRKRYPFEIDAIVVLPDHLHTIWRLPEEDCDYSRRWMVLKRMFSAGFTTAGDGHATLCPSYLRSESQIQKREKGIWQRRFWEHTICGEEDWRRHMDYIHYNPVKHGYVGMPMAWPYSSFRRAVMGGFYGEDWGAVEPGSIAGMTRE